jgi:hypothetical protein
MEVRRIQFSDSKTREVRGIACRRLRVRGSGSGAAILEGRVKDLELTLSGSCSVDARELIAESVTIAVSGSAEVYAYADMDFCIDASGSAHIHLFGDGQLMDKHVSGSAKVIHRKKK